MFYNYEIAAQCQIMGRKSRILLILLYIAS